jgi:DNA-binding HxlR family transcriptional regulator
VPDQLRRAAKLVERRWMIALLYASLEGASRFNEFRQAAEGIPPRTLTERLRDLEQAGLLERRLIPASPPYAEYRLTASGRSLAPAIRALERWQQAS